MNRIPRIIHQTWKDTTLPSPFDVLSATWKEFHPDWEFKIWSDEMNRCFIRDHYPGFLDKYDSYPKEIQRVDAFRYFLLHKEGGIYIDLDFECLENISPLLENESCVIGKEPKLHCDRFLKELILCNAFMASAPGHHFMESVCNEIIAYPFWNATTPGGVLESTGPFILTDVYQKYKYKENVRILESDTIYPLTMFETKKVFNDLITDEMQERIDRAYAVHYFWGGW